MNAHSHRPIFVLGCPRSGTTLLQQMLHCHPRIALPSETKFVIPVYQNRVSFGDLEVEANRRALGEWITKRKETKFKALRLDPDLVTEEIAAAPPTIGSALAAVFRTYAREHGKPRWGDKRPSYFRRVPMLQRMFPDAQFVHLIRDGRDAIGSLKKMPWYNGNVFTATQIWREAMDQGRRLAERLGPETFHEFRYEDLVDDPERELRTLCDFLGEDFDPAMTEHHHHARRTVPQSREWHLRTHQAVNSQNVGAWEGRLEPWELSMVEHILGSRLAERGYEPSGAPRPSAATLMRFHQNVAYRRRSQGKQAVAERLTRTREPNPVVSKLEGSALSATTPGA